MKRKTYASILAFTGILCACGMQPVQQPAMEAEPTAAARPTAPADNMLPGVTGVASQPKEETVNDLPKVGMVISESGIDDGSFNQSAWEGLQWLEGSMDCDSSLIMEVKDGDEAVGMEHLVESGCDLCWGIGVNCADAVLTAAEKHPDVQFAIADTTFEDLPENVTAVVFRAQESSFLAGYIAGRVTESGYVGFVGGERNDVIDAFYYGFGAGVQTAAKERGIKISTCTIYVDSFDDPEEGYKMAKTLYDQNCDVVYHAAGASGLGVIRAAEEEGKYVIGVDKDQSYLAPDHVLCSALKYVNVSVKQVSEGILKDDIVSGQTIELGLAENAVGITEDHPLYSQEIYEKMLDLQVQIVAGELTPPSTEEEYNAFCGQ